MIGERYLTLLVLSSCSKEKDEIEISSLLSYWAIAHYDLNLSVDSETIYHFDPNTLFSISFSDHGEEAQVLTHIAHLGRIKKSSKKNRYFGEYYLI